MTFDNIKDHEKYRKKENIVISKTTPSWGLEWRKGHLNSTIFKENKNLMKGKILYLGCNDGTSCCILSQYCDELVGIDINEEALESAKELLEKEKITNLKLVHTNVCDMPFEDGSFDGIYALQFFEHIFSEDQENALKEIKRVLKKGKPLYAQFPHPRGESYIDHWSKQRGRPEMHVFFFKNEGMVWKHFGRFFKVEKVFRERRTNPGRPTERHNDWGVVLRNE